MKRIIIPLLIAAFLWFFMFSPWTSGIFNFWTAMSFSAIVLMNMAFALRPQWWIEDVKFDWKNIDRSCRRNLLAGICAECSFEALEPECRFYCDNISLCIGTYLVVQLYAGDGGVGGWCYLGIGLQIVSSEIGSIDCVACSVGCGGICCVSDLMTHHGLHGFTQMKKYIFDFPALYLCKSV